MVNITRSDAPAVPNGSRVFGAQQASFVAGLKSLRLRPRSSVLANLCVIAALSAAACSSDEGAALEGTGGGSSLMKEDNLSSGGAPASGVVEATGGLDGSASEGMNPGENDAGGSAGAMSTGGMNAGGRPGGMSAGSPGETDAGAMSMGGMSAGGRPNEMATGGSGEMNAGGRPSEMEAGGSGEMEAGGRPGEMAAGGSSNSGGETADCTPDPNCEPAPPDTGDFHEDCVARVNQFRACVCLGPLARNAEAEDCAAQQAQYDYENDTFHGGIRAKICSPPNLNNAAQNECPEYPSVASTVGLCHQQMFDEGECDDFQACGHYLNITDDGAESVACGYYETPSGDVWMVQNFY